MKEYVIDMWHLAVDNVFLGDLPANFKRSDMSERHLNGATYFSLENQKQNSSLTVIFYYNHEFESTPGEVIKVGVKVSNGSAKSDIFQIDIDAKDLFWKNPKQQ